MICHFCGVEAPTRYVAFYSNIGLLVLRFGSEAEGDMCKSCIHSNFWKLTLTSLFLGWFGVISFIINPFLILNNVIRYLFCLGMEPVPPGATPPELSDDIVRRIDPYTEELIDMLNRGEDVDRVIEMIAMKANVSHGQVALYIHALVAAAQEQE